MEKITKLRPQRVSDAIQATATEVLSKIDIYSKFQGLVNKDPKLFDCTIQDYNQFINFTQTMNTFFMPTITRTFVLKYNESFCMIDYSQNLKKSFIPYYAIKLSNGSFLLKEYSSLDNFENFDPFASGKAVQIIDDLIEFISTIKNEIEETVWTDGAVFLKDNELTLTSLYHVYNPNQFVSGISISATYLLKEISQMVMQKDAYYAICNMDNKLILESRGNYSHSYKFPLPLINESFFWSDFFASLDINNFSEIQKSETYLEINGSRWVFVVDPKTLRNFGYRLYVAVDLNGAQGKILYHQSIIFVVSLILTAFVYFVSKLKNVHSKRNKRKTNAAQINTKDAHLNALLDGYNGYYKCLTKIRNLELLYSDDILLNKVLDSIGSKISENPENLHTQKLLTDCKICNSFVSMKKQPFTNTHKVIYSNWVKAIPSDLKQYRLNGLFRYSDHEQSPVKQLIQLCTTLLFKFHLFVLGVDPDILIAFIIEVASRHVTDPVYTAFRIQWIFNLLDKYFNEWLHSVEDKLVVLLTVLLYGSEIPDTNDANNVFVDDIDKYVRLNFHMHGFNTQQILSKIKKIVNFVQNSFGSDSTSMKYILHRIADNFLWLYMPNSLELLGMFAVRIESPEFSVFNNLEDRTLFAKFILAFSEYSCYLVPNKLMVWASAKEIERYFMKEEMEDEKFIAQYHLEVISKVVRPWIAVVDTFKPLEKYNEYLDESEQYWKAKMYCVRDSAM